MASFGSKICWLLCLCGFTGCSMLDRIQNCNFACRSPGQPNLAQAHAGAEPCEIDGVTAPEFSGQEAVQAMQMAHMDQMKAIQQQLDAMSAREDSLQEQLAMLDKKMEKQMEERQPVFDDVERMSRLIEGMQDALENHDAALGGIESHLVDQHANYETLLTGLEQQLGDILAEYDETETDSGDGSP